MVKCQHTIKSYLAMTCKSTLLCNLPGTFSLDNYTCNCMSLGKTYSLQCCFFFFLISIKLLQSWDSPRDQLNVFFSFFCWYPYSLSSAIPYNRPNLHSYHHERIPPFQFTVTNVHHFECCAYFTLFICNIYGWRSCTWKCIKWCIEPPTPLPPIRVCIFSLNWSHHMHHCHVL